MSAALHIRLAARVDLPEIVHMLADDELGSQRERFEQPLPECYFAAFDQISYSPFFELVVGEFGERVVGTLQLIFIPSISYKGGLRAQVESVRVEKSLRGQGIGTTLMEWAMERARQRGAHILQLTTHNTRTDAHRFYKRLGFVGSHLGMKISLKSELYD